MKKITIKNYKKAIGSVVDISQPTTPQRNWVIGDIKETDDVYMIILYRQVLSAIKHLIQIDRTPPGTSKEPRPRNYLRTSINGKDTGTIIYIEDIQTLDGLLGWLNRRYDIIK
jgi:hypothetical protein